MRTRRDTGRGIAPPGTVHTAQHLPLVRPLLAQLHYQQGEKRLMLAVLMDAVGCIERYSPGRRTRSWPAFHAACRWILDHDRTWLFSFENICLALDLDPHRIRSLIFAPLHLHSEPRRYISPEGFGKPPAGSRVTAAAATRPKSFEGGEARREPVPVWSGTKSPALTGPSRSVINHT